MTANGIRVLLVYMESVESGTAAGHHFRGTIRRLETAPDGEPLVVRAAAVEGGRGPRRWLRVAGRAARELPGATVVLYRFHPAEFFLFLIGQALGKRQGILLQGRVSDAFSSHPWVKRCRGVLDRVAGVMLARADFVIVPDRGLSRESFALGGRQADEVIPNGPPLYDSIGAPDVAEVRGLLPEVFAFLGGALTTWQGVGTLLEAVNRPEWPDHCGLVVIGDGVMEDEMRRAADAAPGRIVYLGRRPAEYLRVVLGEAAVSLSPKYLTAATELGVSPFKIIEAAAAGVPVVVTDVPGQADVVREYGIGEVIPPADARALAEAVASVIEESPRRERMICGCADAAEALAWENGSARLLRWVRGSAGQAHMGETDSAKR